MAEKMTKQPKKQKKHKTEQYCFEPNLAYSSILQYSTFGHVVFIYSVVRFWSNVPVSEKPGLKFTKLCNHSFLILQTPLDKNCNLFHCKIEIVMLRHSLSGEVIFFLCGILWVLP